MWNYRQSTGELTRGGDPCSFGYSGHGDGKNNPAMQNTPCVGPIPQGSWVISGPPIDTVTHGPYVLHLWAETGTETFGRDGFLIHGDSVRMPGTASEGCIILPRPIRELIWESGDRDLQVTA